MDRASNNEDTSYPITFHYHILKLLIKCLPDNEIILMYLLSRNCYDLLIAASNVRPQPFVMFANKQLIRRVDLNESNFRQIPTGNLTLNNTVAIDYDLR